MAHGRTAPGGTHPLATSISETNIPPLPPQLPQSSTGLCHLEQFSFRYEPCGITRIAARKAIKTGITARELSKCESPPAKPSTRESLPAKPLTRELPPAKPSLPSWRDANSILGNLGYAFHPIPDVWLIVAGPGRFRGVTHVVRVVAHRPFSGTDPSCRRLRRAAAQPSLVTWRARPTARASAGTSLVMHEAAPI